MGRACSTHGEKRNAYRILCEFLLFLINTYIDFKRMLISRYSRYCLEHITSLHSITPPAAVLQLDVHLLLIKFINREIFL
jgi:hypothetical protein